MSRRVTADERRSTGYHRRKALPASLLQGATAGPANRRAQRRFAVVLSDSSRAAHGNSTADWPRLPARARGGHDRRYPGHPSRTTVGKTAVVAQAAGTNAVAR